MSNLDIYINNLGEEFKRLGFDDFFENSKDEQLLFLYAYYHYYNADSSKINDIIQGNTYSWNSSDHITGIFLDEDSDGRDVDAVVSVFAEDNSFDIATSIKAVKDAETAMLSARENKNTVRKEIDQIVNSDDDYKFSDAKPLKIRLITNYSPKNATQRKAVLNALSALTPETTYVSYSVSFGMDLEYEVLEIEDPKEYVDEADIVIDKEGNCTYFGSENSLIVNISAKSLKSMYEQFSYRGLFAQNLRYYVKNVNVDTNVVESIQNHPGNFWYFNNGIILICEEYIPSGNTITLKKFSIINGGQTTKLIGETDFDNDFYLQCKIVKNKYSKEDDKIEFIAEVAEASNTQKPIKAKDLIANKPEQRRLKKQLADAGIYCQIKRGEKVNKKLYPKAWQNTTNEELGQFILSYIYQRPGAARGNKQSICGNAERYDLLFGKQYNVNLLGDLLKIKAYYKQWMSYVKKYNDKTDEFRQGLINNSMFYMTAIIGAMSKLYYHPDYIDAINAAVLSEQRMEILSQFDISHRFLAESEDMKKQLFALFEYCYTHFLRPGYEFFRSFKNSNYFSNFTKVGSNYSTYIIKQLAFVFQNGIPEVDKPLLDGIFYSETEADRKADIELLEKYVNIVYVDANMESSLTEDTIASIKEMLIDYRTKVYKEKRIKTYEVFKNLAADRIAKYAPTSIEDLERLRCMDKAQIDLYGKEIIKIVQGVLSAKKEGI